MASPIDEEVRDSMYHSIGSTDEQIRYRIIMIPGNPGLISFYREFLQDLATRLQAASNCSFVVQGFSLAGFEVESQPDGPFGLQDQVDFVETRVDGAIQEQPMDATESVILIGHSVGAYILLEVLRRYYEKQQEQQVPYRIAGGICLFPTVVDIAQSKSGRRVGWVLNLPGFALVMKFIIVLFLKPIPISVLAKLVKFFTGFPDEAVSTISEYLRSSMGPRETFHMARDEMNEINADRWDEDIWGSAAASQHQRAKLFFYFGDNDHWVAQRTRDDLIATRALRERADGTWRPQMEIDQEGTPHGFCIRHSKPVASRCAQYIEDIVSADQSWLTTSATKGEGP